MKRKLCFVVESGTDVRLVEELARRYELLVLGRSITGGRIVSQDASEQFDLRVGPAHRVRFFFFVLKHLLATDSHVILCQGYGLAALAAGIAGGMTRRTHHLLICSPIEAYYSCRRLPDSSLPYRRVEYAGLAIVARLNAILTPRYLVLSRHLGQVVRTHGATDVTEVPVYGVDLGVYTPADSDGAPRHGAEKLVFFSSRIAPEKDATTLLRAVRILLDGGVAIKVVHRSGGFREFHQLASRMGLGRAVDARDAVPPGRDLAELYRKCDVCVQASREEGLGFSVLESMACGTPVVAAAVGGLRETVVDGETGWSYTAGDPDSLAGALGSALADIEESRRRAAAALEMVRRKYRADRVFDTLDEALQP